MGKEYRLAELRQMVNQVVATSEWVVISQERINAFADATEDRQWIHCDKSRCEEASPFGKPIAHGFLTLSLIPKLMGKLCMPTDAKLTVNYGMNKVRYPSAVPVDSRVRGHMKLLVIEDLADCAQLVWQVTVEREGAEKPACVAEVIFRQYPG